MAEENSASMPPTPPTPPDPKPRRADDSPQGEKKDSRPEAQREIRQPEDSPLNNGPFIGVDPVYQNNPDDVK